MDINGNVLSSLPSPACGTACGSFPAAGLPNAPYLASLYWNESTTSAFDVTHRYYQEQWQINSGAMNKYVTWGAQATVNGTVQPTGTGWAMQYWDVSHQYMGALAQNFTVFDRFFHSYYGGSTPGAISVFAGDLPYYNGSATGCPLSSQAQFGGSIYGTPNPLTMTLDGALDVNCRMINDVCVPGFGTCSSFLPTFNQTTIADLLDAKNVSWAWYAQNWDAAVAQRPSGLSTAHFAYHHQSDRHSNHCTPHSLFAARAGHN